MKTRKITIILIILFVGSSTLAVNNTPVVPTCDLGRKADPNRRFIVVEARGGLGNRLGGIATAYNLALLTDRCLVIDWKLMFSNALDDAEMPAAFASLFNSPLLTMETLTQVSFLSPSERQALSDIQSPVKPEIEEFRRSTKTTRSDHRVFPWSDVGSSNYVHKISSAKEKYITVRLVRDVFNVFRFEEQNYQTYRNFFQNLVKVKAITSSKVNGFIQNSFPKSSNNLVVGVHFRSMSAAVGDGKYQKILNAVDHGTEELFQLFVQRMHVVKTTEKTQGSKVTFFIATDDPSYIPRFIKEFSPDEIIYFPHTKISRDDISGQMSGVIDFKLLEACDYLVGRTQSTFSDLAAILTKSKFKIPVGGEWLSGPNGVMSLSLVSEYSKLRSAKDSHFSERLAKLSAMTPLEKEHDDRRFWASATEYGLYAAFGTLGFLAIVVFGF